jgi:hypothetical protein
MDKLAKRLREDAASIKVEVSPQLDDRIRASLEGVVPEQPAAARPVPRSRSMWWASSLTGVAAAALVLAVINLRQPETPPIVAEQQPAEAEGAVTSWSLRPYLKIENAVSTSPLQEELAALEADLKKAEEAVRKDIGLVEISD